MFLNFLLYQHPNSFSNIILKNLDFKNYLPALGVFLLAGLRLLPSLSLITSSLSRIGYVQYSVEKVCDDLERYKGNKNKEKKTKKITMNLDQLN